jgi:uncharacterized protein
MAENLGSLGLWPTLVMFAGITLLASPARGFSGFGAALILVPLVSAVLGPQDRHAAFLGHRYCIMTAAMVPKAAKTADRRDVLTMSLGALFGIPTGTWLLASLDPATQRLAIVSLASGMLMLLLSGWRYRSRPTAPLTVLVGLLSGAYSGAAQIGGPPVVAYWLGGQSPASCGLTSSSTSPELP